MINLNWTELNNYIIIICSTKPTCLWTSVYCNGWISSFGFQNKKKLNTWCINMCMLMKGFVTYYYKGQLPACCVLVLGSNICWRSRLQLFSNELKLLSVLENTVSKNIHLTNGELRRQKQTLKVMGSAPHPNGNICQIFVQRYYWVNNNVAPNLGTYSYWDGEHSPSLSSQFVFGFPARCYLNVCWSL